MMPRSALGDAQACVALWVVHTVEIAAYAKHYCTGPLTADGEPSPADDVERAIVFEYAKTMTDELHLRAHMLGLDPENVQDGFDLLASPSVGWGEVQRYYPHALRLVGGSLSP